jgi:membrane protein DedA with SNARE-associated domain
MPAPVLASITRTLADGVARDGAYAVFAVMALDALLPAGGELTMLVAGAVAGGAIATHDPAVFGHSLPAGAVSFLVLGGRDARVPRPGACRLVARPLGRPAVARAPWPLVPPGCPDPRGAERWFARHGRTAVFLGRLTPVARSFISIPAGAAGIAAGPYTVLTLLGSAVWCLAFAGAGWALGSRYDTVHRAFTGVEVLVVAVAVLALVALLVRRRARRSGGVHVP